MHTLSMTIPRRNMRFDDGLFDCRCPVCGAIVVDIALTAQSKPGLSWDWETPFVAGRCGRDICRCSFARRNKQTFIFQDGVIHEEDVPHERHHRGEEK